MSENGDALADVTNKVANIQVNHEAIRRVREAQWAKPQEFDYKTYNAAPRDTGPSFIATSAVADASASSWAANATRYEWSEEYGDVAPRHEALENQLFRDENQMDKGE